MGQVCSAKNKKEGKLKLKNVDSAYLTSGHRDSNLNLITKPNNNSNTINAKEKIQIVVKFPKILKKHRFIKDRIRRMRFVFR